MALNINRFDELSEADFQELIDNRVPESKTLDYKIDLKSGDRDKREFLADIASFANTAGGYLLIGIKEEGGIPTAIPGIYMENPDGEKLKLINLIRDCTEPRIPGVSIATVPVQDSRYVLAIHIPKSWASPHVVSFEKHWRFYARHSGGKYALDVSELRQAFLMSDALSEKIRRFHIERVGRVLSGETAANLMTGPTFILHLVPITSFGSGQQVNMSMLEENGITFMPLGASEYKRRYNLDGYFTYDEEQKGERTETLAYTQFFRNGTIESVCVDQGRPLENVKAISITHYEEQMLRFLSASIKSLKTLQIDMPYSLMVTVTGVMDGILRLGGYYSHRNRFFDRDVLQLPDVIIETEGIEAGKIMRPIFDAIWNAAGWGQCCNYNEEGRWSPQS